MLGVPQDPLRRTAVLYLGKRSDQSTNRHWILMKRNVWNPHFSSPLRNYYASSLHVGSEENIHIPTYVRVDHLQTLQPKRNVSLHAKANENQAFWSANIKEICKCGKQQSSYLILDHF